MSMYQQFGKRRENQAWGFYCVGQGERSWEQELGSNSWNDDVEAHVMASTEAELIGFGIWWDERVMEKNEPEMMPKFEVWRIWIWWL